MWSSKCVSAIHCNFVDPRWASATLGVFICIRCSGVHRNLGVHISFVRSVSLDSWKSEHIRNMQRWGNKRANEYWEYNLPKSYPRPTEHSTMADLEKFIRCKYEKRCWVRDADSDYDYSYSDSEEGSRPLSAIAAGRSKTVPTTPATTPVTPAPATPQRSPPAGGLSSLSHRSGSISPIEDLFMSLTLKPPSSGVEKTDNDDLVHDCHTSSISELYGPKSPQVTLGVDASPQRRQEIHHYSVTSSLPK